MRSAACVLTIRFVGGLAPQEIRFSRKPKSVRIVNGLSGWCAVYVNGLPYLRFYAEAEEPGRRDV